METTRRDERPEDEVAAAPEPPEDAPKTEEEEVDAASEDSFPASDPPAY